MQRLSADSITYHHTYKFLTYFRVITFKLDNLQRVIWKRLLRDFWKVVSMTLRLTAASLIFFQVYMSEPPELYWIRWVSFPRAHNFLFYLLRAEILVDAFVMCALLQTKHEAFKDIQRCISSLLHVAAKQVHTRCATLGKQVIWSASDV